MHCAAINNHNDIVEYIINDLQMKELDKDDKVFPLNQFVTNQPCNGLLIHHLVCTSILSSVRTAAVCVGSRAWICCNDGYANCAI